MDGLNLQSCPLACVDECDRTAYDYKVSYASLSAMSVQSLITPEVLAGGLQQSYHKTLELDHRVRTEHLTETLFIIEVSRQEK